MGCRIKLLFNNKSRYGIERLDGKVNASPSVFLLPFLLLMNGKTNVFVLAFT